MATEHLRIQINDRKKRGVLKGSRKGDTGKSGNPTLSPLSTLVSLLTIRDTVEISTEDLKIRVNQRTREIIAENGRINQGRIPNLISLLPTLFQSTHTQ